MALTWNLDTELEVELGEFLDYFLAQGRALFESGLDEAAMMMRRLANNRTFLTQRLNAELEATLDLKKFQSNNLYTPQVFLLHGSEAFFLRVAVWEPADGHPGEDLFFYGSPHDHNFDFMTVGYLGTGYATKIYEYDGAALVGHVDEPTEIRFLEETSLPFGRVIYFRRNADIHTQIPPRELSISINVLKRPSLPRPDQYFFDLERGRSLGKADKHSVGCVVRLAGAIGDEYTVDLLKALLDSHECRRIRLAAYAAVARREGASIWERALEDESELVRKVAERNLLDETKSGTIRRRETTRQEPA